MIAIIGNTEDLCATYVAWAARQRQCEVIELPEDELGVRWSYGFDDHSPSGGAFIVDDERIPFASLSGIFVRLFHRPSLPQAAAGVAPDREALLIVERRAALQHFLACFPAAVMNPPSAGRSNGSKPYQMRLLAGDGFRVPHWIASNDPHEVKRFVAALEHGAVYKACSGLRSRVRMVDDALLERLHGSTPVVVQQYIPGRDVRVHTVLGRRDSGRIFPTEVRNSEGVDYRWDAGEHAYAACDIPGDIADLCFRAAARERLMLAGFDFRVDDAGTWHCLEVNPVPTFITYQAATRQEIGEAVVERLLQG